MVEGAIMTWAAEILTKARDLVTGDRAKTHGDMREVHATIANHWNAYLINHGIQRHLLPHDVATMMELLKIGRSQHGAFNPDDYIDRAGYAAITGQLREEEGE